MPSNTPNLHLILPGFAEFTDDWWEPLNGNFVAIDTAVNAVSTEVVLARQSLPTLVAFLQVGHNANGTLKPAAEVVNARNSPVYGIRDGSNNLVPLKSRLDSLEFEMLKVRGGQAALIDGLALVQTGLKDMILSGTKDANGYATWMGNTGANATIDGSVTPIMLMIGGYVARIRTSKTVTISGGAGTYVIYAAYQAGGVITVDGDASTPPPATAAGTTSADGNGDMARFTDTTRDFTSLDVQAGDRLTLLTGNDAGTYVVKTVAPGAVLTQLDIIGAFPVGGLSSINYTVKDPLGVVLGFVPLASATPVAGRLYIGEVDFDGSAITARRTRQFRDVFVSEWRSFDVSVSATHEESWTHNLGSDVLDVEVMVSQSNVGASTVERLSQADLKNNLAVTVTDTHSLSDNVIDSSQLSFNPGTGNSTMAGSVTVTLAGTVTAPLTGTVTPTHSAAVKWDRNTVTVKNAAANLLYKDYGGTERQTGYVRVVVRKRG